MTKRRVAKMSPRSVQSTELQTVIGGATATTKPVEYIKVEIKEVLVSSYSL